MKYLGGFVPSVDENWCEEGRVLGGKLKLFFAMAALFVVVNCFTLATYGYLWSVLQRDSFYLGTLFLYAANRSWLMPAIVAVPVAIVGLSWISKAFRVMGNPEDEEEFSTEKIAFGFVFPGVWFVAPQRILSRLYEKSRRFAGARLDPRFSGILGLWVGVFWSGRCMDVVRMVARLRMTDYPGYTPVAFSAMASCAFNIVFVLLTAWLFARIFSAQAPLLSDAVAYDLKIRSMLFESFGAEDTPAPMASAGRVATERPIVPPISPPLPVREISLQADNPYRIGRGTIEAAADPNYGANDASGRLNVMDILFSTNGRLSRNTFVKFALLRFAVAVTLQILALLHPLLALFRLLALFPLGYVSLALSIKRWHDHGKSGWMVLINLLPVVGWIYSIYYTWFRFGQPDKNDYGLVEMGGYLVSEDRDSERAFVASL